MQIHHAAIPPTLVLDAAHVYAAQSDIYAIDPRSGVVQRRFQMSGVTRPTVVRDILYVCSNRTDKHTIQALRTSDGEHLWQYEIAGPLPDAPSIADGVVYVGTSEGTIVALHSNDGTLIRQYTIDLGPDVPSYLGPILCAAPTVSNGVVYVSPAANKPLENFVYALQASDGRLLWQSRIPDFTTSPLIVVGDIIYVSTHSRCLALPCILVTDHFSGNRSCLLCYVLRLLSCMETSISVLLILVRHRFSMFCGQVMVRSNGNDSSKQGQPRTISPPLP